MRYLNKKTCVQKSILWRRPFECDNQLAHDPELIFDLTASMYFKWAKWPFDEGNIFHSSLFSLSFNVDPVYNAQFIQNKNVPYW